MTQHTELTTLMTHLFEECKTTFETKNPEYSYDRDFMKLMIDAGEFEGRTPLQYCFTLLLKHITVLKGVSRCPENITNATLMERAIDAINYIIMFTFVWGQEVKRDAFKQS